MFRIRRLVFLLALVVFAVLGFAKDAPITAVDWPTENPVLHFDVEKLIKISNYQNQMVYNVDLVVKNLSTKKISNASFRVYLEDKQNIRIGEGWISLTNVQPAETVKIVMTAQALGAPASFSVVPDRLPEELAYLAPPKLIDTTVYSVPSGARLTVDGKAVGTTPVALKLSIGTHNLTFEKEGFSQGTFPLAIGADALAGGSVTYELGGAQRDTLELRDGTVLTGICSTSMQPRW